LQIFYSQNSCPSLANPNHSNQLVVQHGEKTGLLFDAEQTGYRHPDYARSLSQWGEPLKLRNSKGWLLKKKIPNSKLHDLSGCYPIFSCSNWDGLIHDLNEIGKEFVTISLVLDPFGKYHIEKLQKYFTDTMFPFKKHYVVDLSLPVEAYISQHHLRNSKKALKTVQVKECKPACAYLEDWLRLYQTLIQKHKISGIQAFSRQSFAIQLQVPGIVAFRACHGDTTLGMLLWYIQGDVAYYHLGAFSPEGYKLRASFALFMNSILFFQNKGLRWLNLGGVAGYSNNETSGLARFKRGWSTGTKSSYFCGRVLNPRLYQRLCSGTDNSHKFFPLYRAQQMEQGHRQDG